MLLNYLGKEKCFRFFVIGFFLATYLNLGDYADRYFREPAWRSKLLWRPGNENFKQRRAGRRKRQMRRGDSKENQERGTVGNVLRRLDLIKHWLIGLGAEVGYTSERMYMSEMFWPWFPLSEAV